MYSSGRLGITGGHQPIVIKQLKFDPTVLWKRCLRLCIKKYPQIALSADGVSSFLLDGFELIISVFGIKYYLWIFLRFYSEIDIITQFMIFILYLLSSFKIC
jgi:hypothetical protein